MVCLFEITQFTLYALMCYSLCISDANCHTFVLIFNQARYIPTNILFGVLESFTYLHFLI